MIQPISAAVIEDEKYMRDRVKEILEAWGKKKNLPINVLRFPSYEEYLKSGKLEQAPSIFFLDNRLPGKSGLEIADILKKQSPETSTILMTGGLVIEDRMASLGKGVLDGDIQKTPNFMDSEFEEKFFFFMDRSLHQRRFKQKLSIAVDGLGNWGKGIVFWAKGKPWINEIHAHSSFCRGDFSDIQQVMGSQDTEKIHYHDSLEELASVDSDVFIITTGEYGIDYLAYQDRNSELLDRLYLGTKGKVSKRFRILLQKNYPGLIVLGTNPVDAHLYRATQYPFRVSPEVLTSFTPSTLRARKEIAEEVNASYAERKMEERVTARDIDITLIGMHGMDIPVLGACSVKGKPLYEACPELNTPEFLEAITGRVRKKGLDLMQATQRLGPGIPYMDATEAVLEALEGFAYYSTGLSSSAHCLLPGGINNLGVCSGFPVVFSYHPEESPRIKVKPGDLNQTGIAKDASASSSFISQFVLQHQFLLKHKIVRV